ncbi:MAG: DEAD/DEAH box helicase [Bacteroidales bacterium]|nr:DEAD/DEAH box helicase [Bacteroidales bacterium]
MSSQSSGHTFWGRKWLNALVALDTRHKIERAMQQARKWEVRDIEIRDNMIKTHVSLSSSKQYYLQFFLPRFAPEQIEALKKGIVANPMVMSKLLGHDLDPSVLDIAEALHLSLLPQRWADIKMFCSCPSWGMPCDHVAFALYKLANFIDKDPFIIFSLHGLDLMELLRDNLGKKAADPVEKIPLATQLIEVCGDDDSAAAPSEPAPTAPGFYSVDLTQLDDAPMALVKILPRWPGFYARDDFQALYASQIAHVGTMAAALLEGRAGGASLDATPLPPTEELCFAINSNLTVPRTSPKQLTAKLILSILAIDADDLPSYHPSVQATHLGVRMALNFLMHGAVVPCLLRHSRSSFAIVWLPAVADAKVQQAVEQFDSRLPRGILTLQTGGTTANVRNHALLLLSLILNVLMQQFSKSQQSGDDIFGLFFLGQRFTVRAGQDKSQPAITALQIKSWTDHLAVSHLPYSPTVVINKYRSNFLLSLAFDIEGHLVNLRDIMSDEQYASRRYDLLPQASLLAPFIKDIDDYIAAKAEHPILYSSDELGDFIDQILPLIQYLNINTVIPDELRRLLKPAISLKVSRREGESLKGLALTDLLEFQWQVSLDDEQLPLADFIRMTSKRRKLFFHNGKYYLVDYAELQRLQKMLRAKNALTASDKLQALLGETYIDKPLSISPEVRQMMHSFAETAPIDAPSALMGTLRPYQLRGFQWLYRNTKMGFGSIIADDMGLGKTIQVMALLLKLYDEADADRPTFLVVAPTTLVANWEAELQRFAPSLPCLTYHGSERSLSAYSEGILLTTYGILRNDADLLKERRWDVMVIDEAQNIKNANAAQSQAVRKVEAATHIAMSGTPIENRMTEFWSIMDFANHGYLGSAEHFRIHYALPIQQRGDKQCAERFRKITAPFLLRRLKTDTSIINDLPDKIEENMLITLTDKQAELYRHTVDQAMSLIEAADTSTQQNLFKRQGMVLQMILALKQVCDHPALFLKNGDAAPELSGKAMALLELIEKIIANRQKVLIFTQFRQMGQMLAEIIADRLGIAPLFLHGGTPVGERRRMVDIFQNNADSPVFILSIKAGGTGLNLTAASHVVHYDLWWNPAVEQQATDRAYRIGQHQNVIVHRFVCHHTFEEQIDRLLHDKRRLADLTIATGESWIGNLSNEELADIFG